ncbi:MAG: hypothetical protein ACE5DW_02670 [Thermodesulfobacteriota bacterium]
MAMQKNVKRLFTIGVSFVLGLGLFSTAPVHAEVGPSSSTDKTVLTLESVRQNYLASMRAKKLRGELSSTAASPEDPLQWLRKVEHNSVNMVTNRLSSDEQKVVSLEGKDYYVPNADYGFAFKENPSLRYATDPLTGNKIDKSMASAYADYQNKVLYFESEQSYREFLSVFSK